MSDKERADRLVSMIVRLRGACEACGQNRWLECAHIMPRRFNNTRCDEDNLLALCHYCHTYYTGEPDRWTAFCKDLLGEAKYDELQKRAFEVTHRIVWSDVVQRLKVRARALELV